MGFIKFLFIGSLIFILVRDSPRWLKHHEQSAAFKQALLEGGASLEKMGIPAACSGKKFCVTVFVAPWCSVCQASESTFKAFNQYLPEHRPDVGFGIVIGADSASENFRKKEALTPIECYIDDSGSIMRLRGIEAFPTWITTTAEGREVFRKAAGIRVTNNGQIPEVLKFLTGE